MSRILADQELVDPNPELIKPISLSVDARHSEAEARHLVRIAQLLYTFWNTGDERYLHESVDPSFVDNTLPPGRPQGITGPTTASATFRAAVPDLTCELSDLLIAGNRLAVRLRFRGHFSGVFNGVQGSGQDIDFVAFDIQHVGAERITEDWHLEDNLTFLSQSDLVTVIGA